MPRQAAALGAATVHVHQLVHQSVRGSLRHGVGLVEPQGLSASQHRTWQYLTDFVQRADTGRCDLNEWEPLLGLEDRRPKPPAGWTAWTGAVGGEDSDSGLDVDSNDFVERPDAETPLNENWTPFADDGANLGIAPSYAYWQGDF